MNYLNFLLVFIFISFSLIANAQESQTENNSETPIDNTQIIYDKEFYNQEKFDYTWTDSDGVEHTSKLTEKATTTAQIEALLNKIFYTPEIPGIVKIPRLIVEGDPFNDTYEAHYTTHGAEIPVEGMTVLLIEVRDDISGNSTSPERIKSAQLLTSQINIKSSTENPEALDGTIYNINANLNKFFFISKGKPRLNNTDNCSLFGNKFEIFSPADNKSTASTLNAYDKLNYGINYDILHDCGVILSSNHFFHMGTSTDTKSYPINICIYIPSYRMTWWSGRENSGNFTWYNPDYLPFLFTYTVSLEAQTTPNSSQENIYDVTLNWQSSFDIESDSEIPQEYFIYKVIDGITQETPINEIALTEPTYKYQEEQLNIDNTITYIIKARPTSGEFDWTASNTAEITIPAITTDATPNIAISVNPTSNYNFNNETNDYSNTITIINDDNHRICHHFAEPGTTFIINRYNGEETQPTQIASIEILSVDKSQEDGYNYYAYSINGIEQSDKWKCEKPTAENPHPYLQFGENAISISDNFSASTTENAHTSFYKYQLIFSPSSSEGETSINDISSNIVTVNIPKTSYTVQPEISFTATQIAADTDHNLQEGFKTKITLSLQNNPLIREYSIYRDNTDNVVAYVNHKTNGDFECFIKENGAFISAGTISASDSEAQLQDFIFTDEVSSEKATYVTIISAYTYDGLLERIDTYGSDKKEIGVVNVILSEKEKSHEGYVGQTGCKFNITTEWQLQYDTDIFTPVRYNLWRSIGQSEELIASFYGDALPTTYTDSFTLEEESDKTLEVEYRLRAYAMLNSTESHIIAEDLHTTLFEIPTSIGSIENNADFKIIGNNIETSSEFSIYNINGIKVNGKDLPAGIYIIIGNGIAKKALIK